MRTYSVFAITILAAGLFKKYISADLNIFALLLLCVLYVFAVVHAFNLDVRDFSRK